MPFWTRLRDRARRPGRPWAGRRLSVWVRAAGCLVLFLLSMLATVVSMRDGAIGDILTGAFGTLFFGLGVVLGVRQLRSGRWFVQRVTRVWEFAGVARRELDRIEEMVGWLRELPPDRAAVELADLGRCPGPLDALFFHAGRGELTEALLISVERVRAGSGGVLDVVLASLDRDGRVREAAVRRMAAEPAPGQEWFLVERAVDHVPVIRQVALGALAALLAEQPGCYEERVWRGFARVAGRDRAVGLRALLEGRAGTD
ncbi:hypothetical protein ACTOB_001350 [Actinoplanes oblitus]|uniref:HEAT repeat domain-containing protein n=1 Tax=Actinoplanes oblitus TaxID=3040509 RepID=A0ABY8WLT8_9ACTN|nr:hypothetical protein [Actinoplanes oblitus]WIM97797.1 hypothetical protein ACTOB_001350 [Actinoplanes oblitus]